MVAAWVALVATCGCAGEAPQRVGRAQQALEGGELDTETLSVFRILNRDDGRNGLCTGTLILPNLILTARHCVAESSQTVVCGESPFGDTYSTERVLFSNDAEPDLDSTWHGVRSLHVPSEGVDGCGFDVALAILDADVPGDEATPAEPRLDSSIGTDEVYTAVGYGISGDENDPDSFGRRLRLSDRRVACEAGTCPRGVTEREFGGDAGVCGGDSGGPALDVEGRVAGVVSRGVDPCSRPVYGDVASWADWIREIGADAADLGDYDAPEWLGFDDPSGGAGGSSGMVSMDGEPQEPTRGDGQAGLGAEGCAFAPDRVAPSGALASGVALLLAGAFARRRRQHR